MQNRPWHEDFPGGNKHISDMPRRSLLGIAALRAYQCRMRPRRLAALAAFSVLPALLLAADVPRSEQPPRKVLIATSIGGDKLASLPLGKRLEEMDRLTAEMEAEVKAKYPGKRLDLMVLQEYFLGNPGASMAQESVPLSAVEARISECARRNGAYLIVPMLLREAANPVYFSNAAILVDRTGHVAGIYRKVHPVAPQGSDVLEGGTTPGRDFPVFSCDFGRLGIQICFDMLYPDGWAALARKGADIVAMPSASPETIRPTFYAMQYGYYVVSATPRYHAGVFSPIGLLEAKITEPGVLVHEIDLSYEILHWEEVLQEGQALKARFGDKVGFHYYSDQDEGIFWSNDPGMTIGQMVRSLGLVDSAANAARVRELQDKARGGPPPVP